MSMGERVKELRKLKKLTIDEFASLLNVSSGSISQIENNKYPPSSEIILKLCELYNCSSDYIFFGKTSQNEKLDIDENNEVQEISISDREIIYFAKEALMAQKETIFTKNEVIQTKDEVISKEKEIVEIYKNFKDEMIAQKNLQLSIYEKLLDKN